MLRRNIAMNNINRKIKVAIAGYGFGKKVHLEAFKDSKEFDVISFFHPNIEKKKEIEEETGLECEVDWNKLIKRSDIEAIVIATPPEYRFNYAKEALMQKKHLLLEKPVCLRSGEIEELQRIALTKNLSVGVNFEYRAVPLFLQAKQLLEENVLGEIFLIKLDWLMSSRSDPNREWNWYSCSEKGGGVIGAIGTHAFDMLYWFFGEIEDVSGKISTSIKKRPLSLDKGFSEVTSEDVCLVNIGIKTTGEKTIPCQVSLSSISKKGRGFSLEIYGSNGSLFLKSENQKDYVHGFSLNLVENSNKEKSIKAESHFLFDKTWTDGRIAPVKRIHDLWAESINKKRPMIPGLCEGLQSQKTCEAVISSFKNGFTAKTKDIT